MTHPPRNILIVTKADNQRAADLGRDVGQWLTQRRVETRVLANREGTKELDTGGLTPDLVMVLGGDGTMLSVVRKLDGHQVPLLGLNLGRVGFLAELSLDDWVQGLERILDGDFHVQERVALSFVVLRGKKSIASGRVLNDLVVNRGGLARLIKLEVWCDTERLGTVRADGLIVFSPTGATAYAVSAGGPLVHPGLDVFGIAPICPFLSDFRPLVLPAHRSIRIRVFEHPDTVYLTLDGQTGLVLMEDDEIHVRKAESSPCFLSLDRESYFRKLRDKGYFKER